MQETIYAVATFGELRGGNLSLVSTTNLVKWKDEGIILTTREGHWVRETAPSQPDLQGGFSDAPAQPDLLEAF